MKTPGLHLLMVSRKVFVFEAWRARHDVEHLNEEYKTKVLQRVIPMVGWSSFLLNRGYWKRLHSVFAPNSVEFVQLSIDPRLYLSSWRVHKVHRKSRCKLERANETIAS